MRCSDEGSYHVFFRIYTDSSSESRLRPSRRVRWRRPSLNVAGYIDDSKSLGSLGGSSGSLGGSWGSTGESLGSMGESLDSLDSSDKPIGSSGSLGSLGCLDEPLDSRRT
jgi:hypothetical protein